MPIPGARYRTTTTATGKKLRLAFQGKKVVEAKNLQTGATHTPAEFATDRAKRRPSLANHITALRGAGAFQKARR